MKRLTIQEIVSADIETLQYWLEKRTYSLFTNNYLSLTSEERKTTLYSLGNSNEEAFGDETKRWSNTPNTVRVSILRLCELAASNRPTTAHAMGEFEHPAVVEEVFLILMQYLELINNYWRKNSMALLPDEEMEEVREDLNKMVNLCRIYYPDAKYQMQIRLIKDAHNQFNLQHSALRALKEDKTDELFDINSFTDAIAYHGREQEELKAAEVGKFENPLSTPFLQPDAADKFKNRTKRW